MAQVLIACWAWVLAFVPVSAQSPQTVSVIVFPGGFNWPIWLAQEYGYFAKSGVAVTLTNTLRLRAVR
jgi:ABC-type nitrate/sulfonate/bicarbonate transport system substrate-binding protein